MKRLILSVAAGGLMMAGCAGAGPGEEGLTPQGEPLATTQQQLLEGDPPESASTSPNCFLVVYPPYLVWNTPTYLTRGFAYVSCASWQPSIDMNVGLEDEDESSRVRHFTCYNTSSCVGGANAYAPWGKWKTVASARVMGGWYDYRESSWVSLAR